MAARALPLRRTLSADMAACCSLLRWIIGDLAMEFAQLYTGTPVVRVNREGSSLSGCCSIKLAALAVDDAQVAPLVSAWLQLHRALSRTLCPGPILEGEVGGSQG